MKPTCFRKTQTQGLNVCGFPHTLNKNMMKTFYALLIFIMLTTIQSCNLIGDIFRVGMWTGIIVVVLVLAIIIFIISRIRKRS